MWIDFSRTLSILVSNSVSVDGMIDIIVAV
jgi:hypothetical protein